MLTIKQDKVGESTNKKYAVMAVLYSLPHESISTELIEWVASNLPEGDEKGTNSSLREQMIASLKEEHDVKLSNNCGLEHDAFEALFRKVKREAMEESKRSERPMKTTVVKKLLPDMTAAEMTYLLTIGTYGFMHGEIEDRLRGGFKDLMKDLGLEDE